MSIPLFSLPQSTIQALKAGKRLARHNHCWRMAAFPRIEKYDEDLRIFFPIWKRVTEIYFNFISKLYTLIVVVVESFFAKRKFVKFCCCFTTKLKQKVMELFSFLYAREK